MTTIPKHTASMLLALVTYNLACAPNSNEPRDLYKRRMALVADHLRLDIEQIIHDIQSETRVATLKEVAESAASATELLERTIGPATR